MADSIVEQSSGTTIILGEALTGMEVNAQENARSVRTSSIATALPMSIPLMLGDCVLKGFL